MPMIRGIFVVIILCMLAVLLAIGVDRTLEAMVRASNNQVIDETPPIQCRCSCDGETAVLEVEGND